MADTQDPQNPFARLRELPPSADYGSYLEDLTSDILSQAAPSTEPVSLQPPPVPTPPQKSIGEIRAIIKTAATKPYPISTIEELSVTPAENFAGVLGKADILATVVKEPAKVG